MNHDNLIETPIKLKDALNETHWDSGTPLVCELLLKRHNFLQEISQAIPKGLPTLHLVPMGASSDTDRQASIKLDNNVIPLPVLHIV